MKRFLWIGLLAAGGPVAWAFSLVGPDAASTPTPQGDLWQVLEIGYEPPNANVPPYLDDPAHFGPKNLGEGYRRNTPVMYYTFDASFSDWFGANGETAVEQAFNILNNLTNVDSFSSNLVEFPLNSATENLTANGLTLKDVKSTTLSLMLEQLGLTDAIRYTWALRYRTSIPGCVGGCPVCEGYLVTMRNFDYYLTPLGYVAPDWGQYSPMVNGELFGYQILENCGLPNPPNAVAYPIPVNNTVNNPPVASGLGVGDLGYGFFYNGLTRDDAAGLRWLYSTNNYDTPSVQYREAPSAGSALFSTNFNSFQEQVLNTSNLNTLVAASLTNNPTTLQALFPGLVVDPNPTAYFSNVVSPNVVAYFTNYIGSPVGAPPVLVVVTNQVTNIVQFFQNSFGNVVTNKSYTNTTFAIQTTTVGPMIGSPAGSPFVTNVTYQTFQSNMVSGDYFIITNGFCGPDIIQTLQTNVSIVTNLIVGITNVNGQSFAQNLISYFTNYAFVVRPCTLVTNAVADYQGVGRMKFVQVADFDYQNGILTTPVTNQYTLVEITNGLAVTRSFRRVLTTPDFVFRATDLEFPTVEQGWTHAANITRTDTIFNQANEGAGLSGPGTIDAPVTFTYSKTGPDFVNISPFRLFGPEDASSRWYIWSSFDGTTNVPVVYPNGTSIANLAASALVRVSPPSPTLPNGTHGVVYNVALTATGGQPSYTWTLTSNSMGLPPGLSLSPGGVISGTPTQSGTFDGIMIQMRDSSFPIPITILMGYTITIN